MRTRKCASKIYWPLVWVQKKFMIHQINNAIRPFAAWVTEGGIQKLRGQNFAIFWSPLPSCVFSYPLRGQKSTFSEPLPPHVVHVVIERPPTSLAPPSVIQGITEKPIYSLTCAYFGSWKKTVTYVKFESISYILRRPWLQKKQIFKQRDNFLVLKITWCLRLK